MVLRFDDDAGHRDSKSAVIQKVSLSGGLASSKSKSDISFEVYLHEN